MTEAAALTLHMHPLSSYCWKALIALYETDAPFASEVVQGRPSEDAALRALWPIAKMPVLKDSARGEAVPEASIIIEYLQRWYPGSARLIPEDAEAALDVRLWDRVFDLYIQGPLQKVVGDHLRPEGQKDPAGVEEARASLTVTYGVLEARMAAGAARDSLTMADCAAFPALFYADAITPFRPGHPELEAYFERLLRRPSVRRVLTEAQPYMTWFPFHQALQPRFLDGSF